MLLLAAYAWAQSGTAPHAKAGEYPAHERLDGLELGAEYWVHGFRGHDQMFITNGHLVVEVAVYPAAGHDIVVNAGNFRLRLNGKTVLWPQAPAMVAASLKYPDWEQKGRVAGSVGMGGADVTLGQPPPQGRFPGDNRAPQQRIPRVPADATGVPRREPVRAEDVAVESALPEGLTHGPVSGFLYFPWKGKSEKLRSVELLFESGDAALALKLK